MARIDRTDWSEFLTRCDEAHILQTPAWGELKGSFGWTPGWLVQGGVGAQVLFQDLPLGYKVAYIPRGPISPDGSLVNHPDWIDFQDELDQYCRENRAVFLKVEPDGWQDEVSQFPGFQSSGHSIQPPRTLVIDLEEPEDQILLNMKSKTRYNIRLAGRKGVIVRATSVEDVSIFNHMLAATSERADFGIHPPAYYETAHRLFVPRDWARLLLAEVEGEAVAGLMVFALPPRSWYFYGASIDAHRDKMPTYLLQWEAMRWAKSIGCTTYDLWGVPDEDRQTLEDQFTERSDGLWGVYRFKRGFGGDLVRNAGTWDRVHAPLRYKLYRGALALRDRMRGAA